MCYKWTPSWHHACYIGHQVNITLVTLDTDCNIHYLMFINLQFYVIIINICKSWHIVLSNIFKHILNINYSETLFTWKTQIYVKHYILYETILKMHSYCLLFLLCVKLSSNGQFLCHRIVCILFTQSICQKFISKILKLQCSYIFGMQVLCMETNLSVPMISHSVCF